MCIRDRQFLQWTILRMLWVKGVFSLYFSIHGLRKGPGKFLTGSWKSPGFFPVKEWEPYHSAELTVSRAHTHALKRLTVNYDTLRQYLNFNWADFWYSSSFGITWPSNFRHLGNCKWRYLGGTGSPVNSMFDSRVRFLGWHIKCIYFRLDQIQDGR